MKRLTLFIIFILYSSICFSQRTHWASRIVGFSSEYYDTETTKENRAIQILGKPNKLPQVGPSKCAWQPLTQDNTTEEFIIVAFDTIMSIKQVAIAENFGQGSIVKIEAFDEKDNIRPLYYNKAAPTNLIGKMLQLIFPQLTNFKVKAIKLVINSSKVKGWNQIDAIGISQSDRPIQAEINVAPNLPQAIIKENLGRNVNSEHAEITPVISPDGKTLYFTREGHPENIGKDKLQDAWYSEILPDKTWGKAKSVGSPINNRHNNAICSISPDQKTAILNNIYLSDSSMEKGVSMATRLKNNTWSFPKPLKIKNFQNKSNFAEFSLSPDGKTLFITAYFKETFGGKDLYVSFLQKDNSWSEPQNLGPKINTAEDESCPFFATDGETLYFTSKGFSGFGDGDIFMTKRVNKSWTNWSEPQNLGDQINSERWDGYFSIPADGSFAYLSSKEKAIGEEDIFRLSVPISIKPNPVVQLTGGVFNSTTKKPIAAKIMAQGLEESDTICVIFDPLTGDYKMMLPTKKTYSLTASQKGFLPVSEPLDLSEEKDYKEIKKNFTMIPIEAGQKMTLNSVFFEQSKYDLLPTSSQELNRIVVVMKEYSKMEILLEGHTDNQGDWNANLELSKNRVDAVRKYLINKGIDAKRVQIQGWGSTRPIANNQSEEKRKLNRRVEFTIVKN
jgi:outer membrane protein OmpA-like peptidoglycan-associated protein